MGRDGTVTITNFKPFMQIDMTLFPNHKESLEITACSPAKPPGIDYILVSVFPFAYHRPHVQIRKAMEK